MKNLLHRIIFLMLLPGMSLTPKRLQAQQNNSNAPSHLDCAQPSPGNINGPRQVCVGSQITLNDSVTGGTWSSIDNSICTCSPNGVVTGVSGGITSIMYVVQNNCGNSAFTTIDMNVNIPFVVDLTAEGETAICQGDSLQLLVNSIDCYNCDYYWNTGPNNNSSLTVYDAGTYTVTVDANNGCAPSSASVTTTSLAAPPIPIISRSGDTLSASPGPVYYWLFDGYLAQNGYNQQLIINADGVYAAVVMNQNGCVNTSAGYVYPAESINNILLPTLYQVFPNPVANYITVTSVTGLDKIEIGDMQGKIVYSLNSGGNRCDINVENISPGIYWIKINNEIAYKIAKQ